MEVNFQHTTFKEYWPILWSAKEASVWNPCILQRILWHGTFCTWRGSRPSHCPLWFENMLSTGLNIPLWLHIAGRSTEVAKLTFKETLISFQRIKGCSLVDNLNEFWTPRSNQLNLGLQTLLLLYKWMHRSLYSLSVSCMAIRILNIAQLP